MATNTFQNMGGGWSLSLEENMLLLSVNSRHAVCGGRHDCFVSWQGLPIPWAPRCARRSAKAVRLNPHHLAR